MLLLDCCSGILALVDCPPARPLEKANLSTASEMIMVSLVHNKNWNLWINLSRQLSVLTSSVRLNPSPA